jgi:TonB family protein
LGDANRVCRLSVYVGIVLAFQAWTWVGEQVMSISAARHFGGKFVHFLSSVTLVVHCVFFFLATSATAREVGLCGRATGDAAIAACSTVTDENLKSAATFYLRGNEYRANGEFERAISDYNEALRLDPKLASAFDGRGHSYLAKNDGDRAIADFNKAIRLAPNNPTFRLSRAGYYIYFRHANLDAAIADLDRVIALNPKFALAYRIRGNAYGFQRNLDHAIADYDRSLRINPLDKRAVLERLLAYDAKGANIQTERDYQRVLVARLELAKRYPPQARERREEGQVLIAFSIDRAGKVISNRIESGSGFAAIDGEALAMIQRAQPFPPLVNKNKDHEVFHVPLLFKMGAP